MANFHEAYNITLGHEGGYGIDNNGYEVYKGINRLYNPNWQGWAIIDQKKKLGLVKSGTIISDASLDAMVEDLVKIKYWNPIKGNEIINQSFANFLFDYYYASGGLAVKKLQQLLKINQDGSLGPITLSKINEALKNNGKQLFNDFWEIRFNHNLSLVPNIIPQKMWNGVSARLSSYKNSFQDFITEATSVAKKKIH